MNSVINRKISVAPMMSYTDRHFRMLIRTMTRNVLLYTEMVATGELLKGDSTRVLEFSKEEHPLALQLGGSNPSELAQCAKMAEDFGYDEVNLNVGCPSQQVQLGRFGACLMKEPQLVAECVGAMQAKVRIPVTVKTRIGVDDLDAYDDLAFFINTVAEAGCRVFIIHARKAWLRGLSPKDNRNIPPLHYDQVHRLKQDFPHFEIIINGGIQTIADIERELVAVDGVMMGRAAVANPYLFAAMDQHFFKDETKIPSRQAVLLRYLPYIARELSQGVPLKRIARHLFYLFRDIKGAKQWRRHLSEHASLNDVTVIEAALQYVV